jgi:hypothetical protein
MQNRPDFDGLMRAVCVGCGYCGSLQDDGFVHVTYFFPERGRVTAEQFVDWLFMAEGEQRPVSSPSAMLMREKLLNCFIGYMGSDHVNAWKLSDLRNNWQGGARAPRPKRR